MSGELSVLFVCHGNICRSPMGEAILKHMMSTNDDDTGALSRITHVDSCGTSTEELGNPPDRRGVAVMKKHGITNYTHTARQFNAKSDSTFDYIFVMDDANMRNVTNLLKGVTTGAKVHRLGEFDPQGVKTIIDPWYGSAPGFDTCYDHVHRSLTNFLAHLAAS
jgi:protein-tyrosine-phosphatase